MLDESGSFQNSDTFSEESLTDYFEVIGGLLGINRDVFIILLKYLPDSMIRNVWMIYFFIID
jgi:hypothetical protein